eukprot:4320758-Pleurochrysis_carterae.AAC.4
MSDIKHSSTTSFRIDDTLTPAETKQFAIVVSVRRTDSWSSPGPDCSEKVSQTPMPPPACRSQTRREWCKRRSLPPMSTYLHISSLLQIGIRQ